MLAATNNQGIPHLLIERVERFALGSMPWSTCQVYIHKSRHLSQAMKQLLIPLQEKNAINLSNAQSRNRFMI
jgi:hypothetical protein